MRKPRLLRQLDVAKGSVHQPTVAIGSHRHADAAIIDREIDFAVTDIEESNRCCAVTDIDMEGAVTLGAVLDG